MNRLNRALVAAVLLFAPARGASAGETTRSLDSVVSTMGWFHDSQLWATRSASSPREGQYERGRSMKEAGKLVTLIGACVVAAGVVVMVVSSTDGPLVHSGPSGSSSAALVVSGTIAIGVGIPLWVIGEHKMRKAGRVASSLQLVPVVPTRGANPIAGLGVVGSF